MPWTIQNPPKPAKNWPKAAKRRCVAAANAVLRDGGSEQEAIFACLGTRKKQREEGDEYDEATEDAVAYFQYLTTLYFAGQLSIEDFENRFQTGISDHYLRLAILGAGDSREIIEADLEGLDDRIGAQHAYLAGFVADLRAGRMSEQKALWRAGLYGFSRGTYISYTLPRWASIQMPVMPGDDCLGGSLCGCSLDVDYGKDGTAYVYWVLDPAKESCPVCIAHAIESPYVFSPED